MNYAKFIDEHNIEYEPKSVTIAQSHYNPPPRFWRDDNGYLPVVTSKQPDPKEGFYSDYHWEVNENQIIMVWEYFPLPEPDATSEDYENALAQLGVGGE